MGCQRYLKYLALLVLQVTLVSCASLQDYARPQFHFFDEAPSSIQKGFGYRKLTISDFQARSLLSGKQKYSSHLYAQSCLSIVPSSDFQVRISKAYFSDQNFYAGSFVHISFQALFLPDCSWWSPRIPAKRQAYVLQHEQIHFALAELTSRKLTRKARKELNGYVAFGTSYHEVNMALTAKVKKLAHQVMKAGLKMQTAFDEDTSGFYQPKSQQLWLKKVIRRLAAEKTPP